MTYILTALIFFILGGLVAKHFYTEPAPTILKPIDDNRPFTSDELRQIGIIVPDPTRYDCEIFVR